MAHNLFFTMDTLVFSILLNLVVLMILLLGWDAFDYDTLSIFCGVLVGGIHVDLQDHLME